MSEKDLVHYIHTEERMQQSDYEEERRQQIKNSLEENTFQFKDELSSTDDRVKEQKAINERFGSYRKWNEDYLKYLHNKKVQQQINNENNCNINTSPNREARRKSPRLETNSAYSSYDPFSSLLSPPFSGNRQYVMPEYSRNNWGRNYCSPRSGFFDWF